MREESRQNKVTRTGQIDFLSHLKDEFEYRCRKNPRYSLRSFAKSLGVHPSILSSVLKEKRTLTPRLKMQLGLAIGIEAGQLENFSTKSERARDVTSGKYHVVENTHFEILSDWYYFAILETFELESFQSKVKWIAQKLKLNINLVNLSLDKLEACELICRKDPQNWQLTGKQFHSHLVPNETTIAKKNYQKQLLKLSRDSIEEYNVKDRDHTSVVFSIDSSELQEAKKITQKYRKEMIALFSKSIRKDEVYQLQISLFPLTELSQDS